jgi:hypothetical protein
MREKAYFRGVTSPLLCRPSARFQTVANCKQDRHHADVDRCEIRVGRQEGAMQNEPTEPAASPSHPALTRRALMTASGLALAGATVVGVAGPLSGVTDEAQESSFMALSRLLIAHHLEPVVGHRLAAALHADAEPMKTDIDALLTLARERKATIVEDFFPVATAAQQASALRIISAWYLGVIDDKPGGEVIAFELALMFQPVRDVMTIPTYAISGPNGWGSEAPPLTDMPRF